MNKIKVLYISPGLSTFIQKDIDILSSEFEVLQFHFKPKKKIFTPIWFIYQFIFLISNIYNCKAIVTRFGGYHSFLPALFAKAFNKKSITILGGTDCHKFPAYSYGSFNKKILSKFLKLTYQLSDYLAPVHESLIESEYIYDESGKPKQGFKYFFPQTKSKIVTIYNGYDPSKFYDKGYTRIKNSFITVASGIEGNNYYIKGVDLILKIASIFPDYQFSIAGINNFNDERLKNIPENIKLYGYKSSKELIELYNQHEFYLQLSIAEGFPNALCEAMLCGCIPIGSNVFGIPFIIDNCGFILEKKDVSKLELLINNAVKCDKIYLSKKSTERIKNNFSIEKRAQKLIHLIKEL
ncbi:MAG: glycosyltransferase family 4 protein [Bacteroidia bacterium]